MNACIFYFEIDVNKIGIYLTKTEFYAFLFILVAKLIYDYVKGIVQAKMVKIIKFMFFAQKVSSGMGTLRLKFLGG